MKHFETLALQEGATQEDIQVAYERLSKELNPSNNDNQEFFVEEYKKVQEAYKALHNTSILTNSTTSPTSSSPSQRETPSSNSSGSFTVTISPEKIEELKKKNINTKNSAPDGLKVLCVLSMVGSCFWMLCFLLLLSSSNIILIIGAGIMAPIFVLKFIGAFRTYKLKKSGFLMYTIPSIIVIIMMIVSLIQGTQDDPVFAFVTIISWFVFLTLFYSYKKYLN